MGKKNYRNTNIKINTYIKIGAYLKQIAPSLLYFLDLTRYFLLWNKSIKALNVTPKPDKTINTVSCADENLLKVTIHINIASNNKISYNLSIEENIPPSY